MAHPEHIAALKQGWEAFGQWRNQHPGTFPDLSDADLTGEDLSKVNLAGADLSRTILRSANLTSAPLENAKLQQADLRGANCEGAKFNQVDLRSIQYEGAIFRGASFDGASLPHGLLRKTDCIGALFRWTDLSDADLTKGNFSRCNFHSTRLARARLQGANLKSAQLPQCDLHDADLTGADCEQAHFGDATLTGACLRNTNLKRCNFTSANLSGAEISHADFYEAILTDARMERLRGAPAARNLLTARIDRPVYYFESAILSPIYKWLDWEKVRIAGRLPLFGASYSALVAIPLFFYLWKIYNDKVALLRSWAQQTLARGSVDYYIAEVVVERLHPLPKPALSALLLVSTAFLAIASSIYAFACPSRVQEFSRDQWTYQLGLSAVHYMADAWRRTPLRVAAIFFYFIGGTGAAIVLTTKLVNVAEFLLRP
jgi:uncharacterized protein YjbI with pentapeptide repeats